MFIAHGTEKVTVPNSFRRAKFSRYMKLNAASCATAIFHFFQKECLWRFLSMESRYVLYNQPMVHYILQESGQPPHALQSPAPPQKRIYQTDRKHPTSIPNDGRVLPVLSIGEESRNILHLHLHRLSVKREMTFGSYLIEYHTGKSHRRIEIFKAI